MREGAGDEASGPSEAPLGPTPVTSVVAVASGDGIGRIFRSLGVQRLIAGGQSMNPSIAELVEAVDELASDEVIVLPNNGNIRRWPNRVDELSAKRVWVVPTETIAEGFAALLAYDPEAGGEANAAAMEAIGPQGGPRRGHPGRARLGDRRRPRAHGRLARPVARRHRGGGGHAVGRRLRLLDLLVTEDHDLVTIIEGEGSGAADTRRITEWLKEARPMVETEVHHGGQPLYPYLFSIE